MTRAYNLYKRYTQAQLVEMGERLRAPYQGSAERYTTAGNIPAPDGIYLYPRKVRDKTDDIARAISWHLEDAKKGRAR